MTTRRASPKAKAEPKSAPKAATPACEHCGVALHKLADGSWHHERTAEFIAHRPVITE